MCFEKKIDRHHTYSAQWDFMKNLFGVEDLLPFTVADMDFSTPQEVKAVLEKRVEHGIFGYTNWRSDDFREAVKKWYLERFKVDVDTNDLVESPTVLFSISVLLELISKEGDGVILQVPAYNNFFELFKQNGRKLVTTPLINKEGHYEMDWEDFEDKLKDENNRVFLLCSPHNPTGRVWTREELERMITLCQKYNVFIISDEIHMDIVKEGYHHIPLLELTQDHMALFTSTSKTFNLASLLFSYGFIPDPELRLQFTNKASYQYGMGNTSVLGLIASIAAYQNASKWVDDLNHHIDRNRQLVTEVLAEALPDLKVTPSESTYVMWLDLSHSRYSIEEAKKRLVEIGKVGLMPGEKYGEPNFLRLNIACPKEKLQEGLRRIVKALN